MAEFPDGAGAAPPASHLVRASSEARPSPGGTIGLGRDRDWAGAGKGAGSRPEPTDSGHPVTPRPSGHQPSQPLPSPERPRLRVAACRAGPGVMRRGTSGLAVGRRRRRR